MARPAVVAPFTVTPSTGLVDGQVMSVVATGTTPGSTFVFVECDPVALQIFLGQLPPEDNPNDGCEEQRNTVLFSDAAGVVAGTLRASAVLATAAGTADCRVQQLLRGLVRARRRAVRAAAEPHVRARRLRRARFVRGPGRLGAAATPSGSRPEPGTRPRRPRPGHSTPPSPATSTPVSPVTSPSPDR